MTTKLKPCPFCGNEVRLSIEDYYVNGEMTKFIYIACKNANCLISPDTGFCKTEQEAIEAWNTRKGENQIENNIRAVAEVLGLNKGEENG